MSADAAIREAHRHAFDADLMFEVVDPDKVAHEEQIFTPDARSSVLPAVLQGRDHVQRAEIKKENAWHRSAAYMIASGMTQKQVAVTLNKSIASVNLLFAQSWFQKMVVDIIDHEQIEGGALMLLKNSAAAAAMTVIEMASDAKNVSPSVRLKASEMILQRALGPVGKERPESSGHAEETADELTQLDKQIHELEGQNSIL